MQNSRTLGRSDENSTAEVYDPATGSFSITGGMEIGGTRLEEEKD